MNRRTSSSDQVWRGAFGPPLTRTFRHGFLGSLPSSTAISNAAESWLSIIRTVATPRPVPGVPPRLRPAVSA
jgi:hypothetical protein